MNQINVVSKRILSVLLAIAVFMGTINIKSMFASASETTDNWKLVGGTGDFTWNTAEGDTCVEKAISFGETLNITKLRLKINKTAAGAKQYAIREFEILDNSSVNITSLATVSISDTMSSDGKTNGDGLNSIVDGIKNAKGFQRGVNTNFSSNDLSASDEYYEFTFSKPVTVSSVSMWCNYCTYGGATNWDIYVISSDLSFVGDKTGIEWTTTDATLESKVLTFENKLKTDRLRIYINQIPGSFYTLWELEIHDSNNINIAATASFSLTSGVDILNNSKLEHLYDSDKETYLQCGWFSSTDLKGEYIDIALPEITEVKDVTIWCNGWGHVKAFDVYAHLFEPEVQFIDAEYKLDSANQIISCIPVGTTAMEVLNKLVPSSLLGASAGIYSEENEMVPATKLKTGDILRIYEEEKIYEEYTIAVFGDVDGDGEATVEDTNYVENSLDTLTTLQKYAASLNGWNVIGRSGAIDWKSAETVSESCKVEFDIIPENVSSLRVRINTASRNNNYQICEFKLYDSDGVNLAKDATITVADGMPTEKIAYLNNENLTDWNSMMYTSNKFTSVSLENEYFDFSWETPVTVCSIEMFCLWSQSIAPLEFEVLYNFGEAEASAELVEQAVKNIGQEENEYLYSDEYVEQVAARVPADSGFTFAFMTDTHIDGRTTYGNPSLQHLYNLTCLGNLVPVQAIVHGGDLIDGVYNKTRSLNYISQATTTLITESEVPVLMTQGNHDDNSPYLGQVKNTSEQYITAEEWYWTVTRNLEGYNIVQNPDDLDGNYFYLDFETEKTRLLMVNTNDLPYILNEDGTVEYLATRGDFAISDAQLDWIAAEALDFSGKEGWGLVVISHVPLHYPNETEAQGCRNAEILTDMLEAFQNGQEYKPDPWGGDFAQSVAVDFSTQGPQEVIACIAGHNHEDLSKEINGIWYITTAASLADNRAYGTEGEDAFDVFTIDRDAKVIYATRFGAGEDRVFLYGSDSISITLEENITVNYYINLPDGYQDAQMQFSMNEKLTTVEGVQTEGNVYKFAFEGVTPQCMTDEINATLIHNENVINTYGAYTVQQYCKSLLSSNADVLGLSDEKFEALKTLVADLLQYGAMAQTYRGYKTEALANQDITGQREFITLTDEWKVAPTNGTNIKITAGGVWFANVNKIYLKFTTPDINKTTLEFDGKTYTSNDFEIVSGSTYIFYSDAIASTAFGEGKLAQFKYESNDEASITYCVNSYVYSKQNQDTNMGNLARALYNYGVSAVAYKALSSDGYVPANPIEKEGYNLIFSDEFDGDSIDTNKWLPQYFPHATTLESGSQTTYTMKDGSLCLYLDEDSPKYMEGSDMKVSSIQTIEKNLLHEGAATTNLTNVEPYESFACQYGYFEMRAKLPKAGANGFATWWLIGAQDDARADGSMSDQDGEIDILETSLEATNVFSPKVHAWNDPDLSEYTAEPVELDGDYDDYYHIYAMDWTPEGITFYIDGEEIGYTENSPQYRMGMLIGLYTDTDHCGEDNGVWPKSYYIDYVRVYQDRNGYPNGITKDPTPVVLPEDYADQYEGAVASNDIFAEEESNLLESCNSMILNGVTEDLTYLVDDNYEGGSQIKTELPDEYEFTWASSITANTLRIVTSYATGQGPTFLDVQVKKGDGAYESVALSNITWLSENSIQYVDIPINAEAITGLKIIVKKANMAWGHYVINELKLFNANE